MTSSHYSHEYHGSTTLKRWYNIRRNLFGWSNKSIPFTIHWSYGELLMILLWLAINSVVVIPALFQLPPDPTQSTCSTTTIASISGAGHNGGECQTYQSIYDAASQLGVMASLDALVMLLPITRNSLVLIIFGVSFETAIKWHRRAGYCALIVMSLHAFSGIWLYSQRQQIELLWTPAFNNDNIFWGLMSWLSGMLTVVIATEIIRRNYYLFFYYTHIPLFISFVVLGCIHESSVIAYMMLPVILWCIDWWIRINQKLTAVHLVSIHTVSNDITELVFNKPDFQYVAGQYVFVSIDHLNRLHSHPLSIASAPHEPYLRVCVKADLQQKHTWSNQLYELAKRVESGLLPPPKLYIEGPYGSTISHHRTSDKHELLLIASGIGITYIRSILYDIIKYNRQRFQHVTMLWVVRDPAMLSLLNEYNGIAVKIDDDTVDEPSQSSHYHNTQTKLTKPNMIDAVEIDIPDNITINIHVYITDPSLTATQFNAIQQSNTQLQLYQGRPHLNEYMNGDSDVSVCGNQLLLKQTRSIYRLLKKNGIQCQYYEDAFEM